MSRVSLSFDQLPLIGTTCPGHSIRVPPIPLIGLPIRIAKKLRVTAASAVSSGCVASPRLWRRGDWFKVRVTLRHQRLL